MEIKKAIITAAGQSQRTLPLQTLVDRDGQGKTALRIIIEEVLHAGVEEIAVVISPGDQKAYESAAGSRSSRLQFVEQPQPLTGAPGHTLFSPTKDRERRSSISSMSMSSPLSSRPARARSSGQTKSEPPSTFTLAPVT